MYTGCIQKLYKMYTTDVCKIERKWIQNVSQILTNFCIFFLYRMKRNVAAQSVCQNVGYILCTFCMHFLSINSYLQKNDLVSIIKTMYTNCIQNSYRIYGNNCISIGFHISTYFDRFIVQFLGNHCTQFQL